MAEEKTNKVVWGKDKFTEMVKEYGDRIAKISDEVEKDLKKMLEESEEVNLFIEKTDKKKAELKKVMEKALTEQGAFSSIIAYDLGVSVMSEDEWKDLDNMTSLISEDGEDNYDEDIGGTNRADLNEYEIKAIEKAASPYLTRFMEQTKKNLYDAAVSFIIRGPGLTDFGIFKGVFELIYESLSEDFVERLGKLYNSDEKFRKAYSAITDILTKEKVNIVKKIEDLANKVAGRAIEEYEKDVVPEKTEEQYTNSRIGSIDDGAGAEGSELIIGREKGIDKKNRLKNLADTSEQSQTDRSRNIQNFFKNQKNERPHYTQNNNWVEDYISEEPDPTGEQVKPAAEFEKQETQKKFTRVVEASAKDITTFRALVNIISILMSKSYRSLILSELKLKHRHSARAVEELTGFVEFVNDKSKSVSQEDLPKIVAEYYLEYCTNADINSIPSLIYMVSAAISAYSMNSGPGRLKNPKIVKVKKINKANKVNEVNELNRELIEDINGTLKNSGIQFLENSQGLIKYKNQYIDYLKFLQSLDNKEVIKNLREVDIQLDLKPENEEFVDVKMFKQLLDGIIENDYLKKEFVTKEPIKSVAPGNPVKPEQSNIKPNEVRKNNDNNK